MSFKPPAFHAAAGNIPGADHHVHGRAASIGFAEGLEASDLPLLVATVLSGGTTRGPAR